jgi:uncharacterized protein YjcR
MPKTRSPNRDKAYEIYKNHKGNIDLVEIANILELPQGTIRGWKNKDKWDELLNGTFQKNTERSKRNKGGQPGNKNATGPPKNKNAESHGFFSKYLPEDTFNIIQEIEQKSPLDILWENISIQYAAIIRAQRIMHVNDQEDLTKILKREKRSSGETSSSWEDEYELQTAWDKQSTFLQAQSRAMKTLEGLVKQYDELLKSEHKTEEQKLRIQKLKVDIKNTQDGNGDSNKEGIESFIKATTMTEDEIKKLFEGDEDGQEEKAN